MGVVQLLGTRDQLVDHEGKRLAGGEVHLYVPNTTTRITSYSDSALSVANTNPVILSGSGRGSIWINRDADVRVQDNSQNLIAEEFKINPDDLSGDFDSGLVPNGSFETDANADNIPDNWTNDTNLSGSSNAIDTTESTDGGQSWRTQSSGSGGGELVTTDYFPVNDTTDLRVNFDLRCTVASGIRNIVRVEWYDVSQVSISNTDVYDSTTNPIVFTSQNLLATPPALARFALIRIIGGTTGGLIAGSTYWDNVRVFYPLLVAGVFDNVTIQNNDIITTNTNGDLNLTPDGTGSVVVGGDASVGGGLSVVDPIQALSTDAVSLTDGLAAVVAGGGPAAAHMEIGSGAVQAKANATTAAGLELNPFGGQVSVGSQSGGGGVTLYETGEPSLITLQNGIDVRAQAAADDDVSVELVQSDATRRGRVGYDAGADLDITNEVNGGSVIVRGNNASSSEILFQGTPGGAFEARNEGVATFQTQAASNANVAGAQVRHANGSYYPVGLAIVPPRTSVTTSETLVASDSHRTVLVNLSNSAIAIDTTLADMAAGAWGWIINISSTNLNLTQSAGVLWLLNGSGGSPATGNMVLARNGQATWYLRANGEMFVWGFGLS